ncbi:MAG TPA: amidohydrolase family protein [Thermaerobacter sp.]
MVPPSPLAPRPAAPGSRRRPAHRYATTTLLLLLCGALLGGTAYWAWAASHRGPVVARTAEGPRPSPAAGQAGSSSAEAPGDPVAPAGPRHAAEAGRRPPAPSPASAFPPDEPAPGHAAPAFDLLIRGGLVVDGTGRPAYRADVAVRGDRIVAVGRLVGGRARRVLDATGRVVAPGFINAHSHTYEYLDVAPGGDADLLQGMTTVVGGVDGRSPTPLGPFLDRLERRRLGTNHALFAGHGSIRAAVMGTAGRAPTAAELRAMARLLERAMQDGALGLSTGLEYIPGRYARTDELVALARVIAPFGGIYSTHLRSEGDGVVAALDEALVVGREAGVAVNVSHFKVVGRSNWRLQERLIARIQRARQQGIEVVADVYPYPSPDYASALPLAQVWDRYPPSDLLIRQTRVRGVEGLSLEQLAAARGMAVEAAARWLLRRDPATQATALVVSEDNLRQLLRQPFTVISTDGGARPLATAAGDARLHPRVFGAYPRVLARYVREQGVLALEEAIHKMTGQPAAFFGLRDRGLVRVGMYADLVVFDPETVADRATWSDPAVPPEGIHWVVVNGQVAVEEGRRVPGVLAGRVLRGGRDALVGRR